MVEAEAAREQLFRRQSGTCEQKFSAHLAEQRYSSKLGQRQQYWTPQNAPERSSQVRVGNRVWSDRVDGPADIFSSYNVLNGAHEISHRNPAHPLAPVPHSPAKSQFERQKHLFERTSPTGNHESEPEVHNANSRVCRWRGGVFPQFGHAGEKQVSRRLLFTENIVTAITVVAHGRCRNLRMRSVPQTC